MPRFDRKKYETEIGAYLDEFEDKTMQLLKKEMMITLDDIIDHSPIWSGSYVSSHRIKVNDEPISPAVNLRKYTPGSNIPIQIDPSAASGLREKARGEKRVLTGRDLKLEDSITIINQSDHTLIVETTIEPVYAAATTRARNRIAAKARAITLTGRRSKG